MPHPIRAVAVATAVATAILVGMGTPGCGADRDLYEDRTPTTVQHGDCGELNSPGTVACEGQ